MSRLAAAMLFVLLAPAASAMDVLPAEIRLDAVEARILVRSSGGSVRVETSPSVLVAASAPDGPPEGFAPSPRVLAANATWRGLDGIVVVVLRRADPAEPVDVTIEDSSRTGVSLEWPPAGRATPSSWLFAVIGLALAVWRPWSARIW